MASVTATYGTEDIEALTTAIHVDADDLPSNTSTGYDSEDYPASPTVLYYFSIEADGEDTLRSPVFSTNADGHAEWEGVIIPAAGSWTLHARNAATDDSAASTVLTVV